jgi:hypothetical protein
MAASADDFAHIASSHLNFEDETRPLLDLCD